MNSPEIDEWFNSPEREEFIAYYRKNKEKVWQEYLEDALKLKDNSREAVLALKAKHFKHSYFQRV